MCEHRRRGIPGNIEKEHIVRAIEEIDKSGVDRRRVSIGFDLAYGERRYPPKYVVSKANKYANSIDLVYRDFVSHMARRHLDRLGFSIVAKGS